MHTKLCFKNKWNYNLFNQKTKINQSSLCHRKTKFSEQIELQKKKNCCVRLYNWLICLTTDRSNIKKKKKNKIAQQRLKQKQSVLRVILYKK